MDYSREQLEDKVNRCHFLYSGIRATLVNDIKNVEDSALTGEGVWITPIDKENYELSKSKMHGTQFKAYLLNDPMSWDKFWADIIIVSTHPNPLIGPYALASENNATVLEWDKESLTKIFDS